jgi:hypothetical protein
MTTSYLSKGFQVHLLVLEPGNRGVNLGGGGEWCDKCPRGGKIFILNKK